MCVCVCVFVCFVLSCLFVVLLFGGCFCLFVCCFGFFISCFVCLFVCLVGWLVGFLFFIFYFIVGIVWNRLAMEILIVYDLLLSMYKLEPKISQVFRSSQVKSLYINHLSQGNSANS